jgi:hypothetical protein
LKDFISALITETTSGKAKVFILGSVFGGMFRGSSSNEGEGGSDISEGGSDIFEGGLNRVLYRFPQNSFLREINH